MTLCLVPATPLRGAGRRHGVRAVSPLCHPGRAHLRDPGPRPPTSWPGLTRPSRASCADVGGRTLDGRLGAAAIHACHRFCIGRVNRDENSFAKTYPRFPNRPHTRLHLPTLDKGHELVPRDVSGESMRGRAEKSVSRGSSAYRDAHNECRRGKTLLAQGCGGEGRIRRLKDRLQK
jgi:hypothetical protein